MPQGQPQPEQPAAAAAGKAWGAFQPPFEVTLAQARKYLQWETYFGPPTPLSRKLEKAERELSRIAERWDAEANEHKRNYEQEKTLLRKDQRSVEREIIEEGAKKPPAETAADFSEFDAGYGHDFAKLDEWDARVRRNIADKYQERFVVKLREIEAIKKAIKSQAK